MVLPISIPLHVKNTLCVLTQKGDHRVLSSELHLKNISTLLKYFKLYSKINNVDNIKFSVQRTLLNQPLSGTLKLERLGSQIN